MIIHYSWFIHLHQCFARTSSLSSIVIFRLIRTPFPSPTAVPVLVSTILVSTLRVWSVCCRFHSFLSLLCVRSQYNSQWNMFSHPFQKFPPTIFISLNLNTASVHTQSFPCACFPIFSIAFLLWLNSLCIYLFKCFIVTYQMDVLSFKYSSILNQLGVHWYIFKFS